MREVQAAVRVRLEVQLMWVHSRSVGVHRQTFTRCNALRASYPPQKLQLCTNSQLLSSTQLSSLLFPQRLSGDLERDAAQRERLQPLWDAAARHADRFSASYIGRRFFP